MVDCVRRVGAAFHGFGLASAHVPVSFGGADVDVARGAGLWGVSTNNGLWSDYLFKLVGEAQSSGLSDDPYVLWLGLLAVGARRCLSVGKAIVEHSVHGSGLLQ